MAVSREELELELIQPHMAQKPVLRGEVGCACVAREVSVERGGMGERGCARRYAGRGKVALLEYPGSLVRFEQAVFCDGACSGCVFRDACACLLRRVM